MNFNSEEIGWPEDTVIFTYNSLMALQSTVIDLWSTQHVFVVSPKHDSIAMSKQAAIDIGLEVR